MSLLVEWPNSSDEASKFEGQHMDATKPNITEFGVLKNHFRTQIINLLLKIKKHSFNYRLDFIN